MPHPQNTQNASRPAGQDGQHNASQEHNHHTPPHPITDTPPQAHRRNHTKHTITIASLNINGFNAPSHNMTGIDKWSTIHRTMSTHKIAILAIQETHLDDELLNRVIQSYGTRLTIIASLNPSTPRASAGVAFVINKRLIKPINITVFELLEGRALALKIKWHENEETTILNIYAPHTRASQHDFWNKVQTRKQLYRLRNPDFLLGDFNVTEDAIDRYPPHPDDTNAITALRDIRHKWGLHDAWRHAYPTYKIYTYRAIHNDNPIKSRLDRIYITQGVEPHSFNWQHSSTAVPTDHWLISVKYAPSDAPYIGNGRWSLNILALRNKKLIAELITQGMKLQHDLETTNEVHINRRTTNLQLIWKNYKNSIKATAQRHNKETYHKINSRVMALKKDIHNITQHPNFTTEMTLGTTEAILAQELEHLEKIQTKDKKDKLKTEIALHGEKLGGIWSALSKDIKPRDTIYRLKIPNSTPPQYERCSKKMAQLARDYHEKLQQCEQTLHPTTEEIETQLDHLLNEIPNNQKLNNRQQTTMNQPITPNQVARALKLTKNGTATGLDGCPYELWKTLDDLHISTTRNNKNGFDIIKTLTIVFNDIRLHGIDPRSDFAQGWMCPIYKKKDRTEISNYRPITILNTDYKLLSKVLAIQLMDHIHSLIHEDQAGFIPRRSIFNHIRLAQTIISYAEVSETNGAIVALDQEKAYDKIHHSYLWKTLRAFQLPHEFINTVQSLYQHATTRVAINGVLSAPFNVQRGVRQGDPLSSPLFDMAIEPLACKIRNSQRITGLNIPNVPQNPKINMFADDTTLFLSEHNSLDIVHETLDHWCKVSGAKFNIEKTEIIPIGTEEYRAQVANTRKINQRDTDPLDIRIHIALDGEAIRSLGAWIGNHTNDIAPWEPIIDQIKKDLNRWNRIKPTLFGRKSLVQAIIGGRTQFLTKAQGMPPTTEAALIKVIRNFIWEDDSSPRIALNVLYLPTSEGGLNLLNIRARNEAIELTWLRTYLNFSPSRPTWATITDLIINKAAPPGTSLLARMNSFLQSWDAPTRGARLNILNNNTIRMLKTARKYNVNLAAIRLSPQLRAQLPAWYHPLAKPRPMTSSQAKCLLQQHNVTTVADLITISERICTPSQVLPHQPLPTCPCNNCTRDRTEGCLNPHLCAMEAILRIRLIEPKMYPISPPSLHGNFSLTPNRKAANLIAITNNNDILFDPTITCKNNLADCFRVFTDPNRISKLPASRNFTRRINLPYRQITIYTDGACYNNGKLNAQSGTGIWYAPNDPRNTATRLSGPHQSNQAAEIAAIIQATSATPPFRPLTIISDSKYAINGLTTHLNTWEDIGWINIKNAPLFKRAAYLLKKRTATTHFRWIKGHSGDQGNDECDQLAKEGAAKPFPNELDLEIPITFDLQGAKLSALTQATAYRGILEKQTTHQQRATTAHNIQLTRDAIQTYNNIAETDETIWAGMRRNPIRTCIKQFLYKAMHGTQKIGQYWTHIPNNEERELCTFCHVTESMDHILTRCRATPQTLIWQLAKNLWPHNQIPWPEITLGIILGCGAISIPKEPNQVNDEREIRTQTYRQRGARRLLQILISEAAHLIWVLRCERVIQNTEHIHSESEIETRWLKAINTRLTEDKLKASKIKRDKRSITTTKLTWEPILIRNQILPNDWVHNCEVLVGRRT